MGLFFSKTRDEPYENTDKKKELRTRMLLDAIKNKESNSEKNETK